LRRWIADGKIRGFRFGPKLILVDLTVIDAVMLKGFQMVAVASDAPKRAKGGRPAKKQPQRNSQGIAMPDRVLDELISAWLAEAEIERLNNDAVAGLVVAKRRGKGQPGGQLVLTTLADLVALLTGERPPEAG
jgi:hypothetical protein